MMQSKNQIKSQEILADEMTDCVDHLVNNCKFETGKIKPLKTPTSSNEKGATMLEYGVMVALILLASVTVVKSLGRSIRNEAFIPIEHEIAQSCIVPGDC